MAQRLDDGFDGRVGVGARTDVGEHHADDVVRDAREARQVGAAFGKFFEDDLGGGFEQAIGERGIEHALVGGVAADVDEHDADRVFAQRRHVERHAQRFLEAVAMRQHRRSLLLFGYRPESFDVAPWPRSRHTTSTRSKPCTWKRISSLSSPSW